MTRFAWSVATLLLAATALLPIAHASDVPYLSGRVVDNAEILSAATRSALADELEAHEQRTGNQIAVLTVPALGEDTIETFATKVFDQWKLGRKGKDNGVLLVIAPNEHRLRIEVGYGLEGTLTDVQASRIIRNVITPAFKAGDFDKGVRDGVETIVATLEGHAPEAVTSGPAADTSTAPLHDPDIPITTRILLGLFVFGALGVFTVVGVVTPGMGWFLYFFLIPFWALFPIISVGFRGALATVVSYLVAFPIAKLLVSRQPWYQKAQLALPIRTSGSFGGFAFGSGSGGGGSSDSGGGGFSGGGGDSGGGGSSGSW